MRRSVLLFGVIASLGGCASGASDIKASYVSPIAYEPYDCKQLSAEAERVSAKAMENAGVQDSNRTKDAVVTTVGVVIFWPLLFAVKGDGANASELARLKGSMDAIESESIRKKCSIQFRRSDAA